MRNPPLIDRHKFEEGLKAASPETIAEIVETALLLKTLLYYGGMHPYGQALYKLRKALEGVWGHDLPIIEDSTDG